MSQPAEWVSAPVSRSTWEEAKALRAATHALYGDQSLVTQRWPWWLGELGELSLRNWLQRHGVAHVHVTENQPTSPDFYVYSTTVDMKTRARRLCTVDDEFGVSPIHLAKPWEWYFYAGWEKETNVMTLYGAMRRDEVASEGRIMRVGEHKVRQPTYEIPVRRMHGLRAWLRELAYTAQTAGSDSQQQAAMAEGMI